MAFRPYNPAAITKFNSSTSSDILNFYNDFVVNQYKVKSAEPKSRTFAPSAFRCNRKNWFRLRGTTPDMLDVPDVTLNYKAEVGTARHEIIQSNLKNALGDDWIDVEQYLNDNSDITYDYSVQQSGYESRVSISNPPIKFACDGIIRWKDKLYLLEIKTADYSSWDELTDPKEIHIDQVKCYCTLLKIHDVLFLYEDRQYGGMKCYEVHVSDIDFQEVTNKFAYIQKMAEYNLAPDKLPAGDYMCRNCEYQKKCKEWG